MGGSSWSDDDYDDRASTRAATGTPTFAHTAAVSAGVATALHDKLNIFGKRREARDSTAHPYTVPIAVVFDETGSMQEVPKIMQQKLPTLMAFLLKKGYVVDPAILIGAVGDFYSDEAPLQIGQFESGVEIDDDITRIYLEGNGGGVNRNAIVDGRSVSLPRESYQNIFYFFGNKVDTDAWEKRGKKGYLFVVGDECPYDESGHHPRDGKCEIEKIFGDKIEGRTLSIKQMLDACLEKWEIFYIIPNGSSHYNNDNIRKYWDGLLGPERVIKLDRTDAVCEAIGQIIGLSEGNLAPDADKMAKDLHDVGSGGLAHVVTKGLSTYAQSVALARVGEGDLPVKSTKSSTTTRL